MTLLVDTSVWSMALRRDTRVDAPALALLRAALTGNDTVVTTGFGLQELLQGFNRPKARREIVARFTALPLSAPDRDDHVAAADLRIKCRLAGVQLGTIDALIAQLCIRHDPQLSTLDRDFEFAARHCPLRVVTAP